MKPYVVAQDVDLHDLYRPVHSVFQVAQIDQGDIRLRPGQGGVQQQLFPQIANDRRLFPRRFRRGAQEALIRAGAQMVNTANRHKLPAHRPAAQHPKQRLLCGAEQFFGDRRRRDMAQRVEQDKAVRLRQALKMGKQRLGKLGRKLGIAACKEGLADCLEGVGNA